MARLWLGNNDEPELKAPRIDSDDSPWVTPLFPTDIAKSLAPDSANFIGAVSWSYRPGSERRCGYFLVPLPARGWAWALWVFDYDDNYERWDWASRAATDEVFHSAKEAAEFLLRKTWEWERDKWQINHFDEIEDSDLLSHEELENIGNNVFPEKDYDW